MIEHKGDCGTNHSWSPWQNPEETEKGIKGTGDLRKNCDRLDHNSGEIA